MIRALIVSLATVVACLALFVHSCSGVRPRVVWSGMQGGLAVAVVRNDGLGEGTVQVDFRLHPPSGPPLYHSEKMVLRKGEEARVAARIEGARGDERVEVQVDYPPR
jgi:hypothetical protein